jgi:hypothetical protein
MQEDCLGAKAAKLDAAIQQRQGEAAALRRARWVGVELAMQSMGSAEPGRLSVLAGQGRGAPEPAGQNDPRGHSSTVPPAIP